MNSTWYKIKCFHYSDFVAQRLFHGTMLSTTTLTVSQEDNWNSVFLFYPPKKLFLEIKGKLGRIGKEELYAKKLAETLLNFLLKYLV